jgi:hypothetical protein
VVNVCGKGSKMGLSTVGQNGNSRMLSGGVVWVGCDAWMMEIALDIWRARAVDALSARVWVAQDVGDMDSVCQILYGYWLRYFVEELTTHIPPRGMLVPATTVLVIIPTWLLYISSLHAVGNIILEIKNSFLSLLDKTHYETDSRYGIPGLTEAITYLSSNLVHTSATTDWFSFF